MLLPRFAGCPGCHGQARLARATRGCASTSNPRVSCGLPVPPGRIDGCPTSKGDFRGHPTDMDGRGEPHYFPGHHTHVDGRLAPGQGSGMARMARIVVPGFPHHVTQRGNRCQRTFLCKDDYPAYLELMIHPPGELPAGLAGASATKAPAAPWAANAFSHGWRESSVGPCAPRGPAERRSHAIDDK